MKAIEYFEKFGERIFQEAIDDKEGKGISDLMIAFMTETKELMKKRHIQIDRGMVPIIREQNQKWNALCNLFEKKKGASPIRYNGFLLFLQNEIPELKEKLEVRT